VSSQAATTSDGAPPVTTFAQLNLSPHVLQTLNSVGFVTPTPIQAQFIPVAMSGQDVMGQARTGTGKTLAFLTPIFEAIKPGAGHCQALILAPTRELALQIHGEVGKVGAPMGFTSITLYGGASYEPQIEALAAGVDLVVGTPGRVMDHMRSHRLELSRIRVAVLDEADRMLDLGFRKDIEYILRHCPNERQTLLLSATLPDDIRKLAQRFMRQPVEIWTAAEHLTVDAVEQSFVVCERTEKMQVLLKLLDVEQPELAIVFCTTKMGAKRLAERLKRLHIAAKEIHGDLPQKQREKIMQGFRTGKVRLLIATDVASRGIDIQNITHIINYDIPFRAEDYVHRIGRTGRMERAGKAFTLVTREEGPLLTEIELLINREVKRVHFDDLTSHWWPNPPKEPPPGYEAEPDEPAAPPPRHADKDRGGQRRRSGGGARGRGGNRAAVAITCSACGKQSTVNFTPTPGKPVYCSECFASRGPSKPHAAPTGPTDSGTHTP
jgi:ATP-dependent RNA helicase DeaD